MTQIEYKKSNYKKELIENTINIDPKYSLKIGYYIGYILGRDKKVLLGKSNKLLLSKLESSLFLGICFHDIKVKKIGFTSINQISYLIRNEKAELGIFLNKCRRKNNTNIFKYIQMVNKFGIEESELFEKKISLLLMKNFLNKKTRLKKD